MIRAAPFVFLALTLAMGAEAAPIYRCVDRGVVTYQELPCPAPGGESVVQVPSAYPPVNALERERLLLREAALDARMLKRAELESAERLAYAALRARELELQAERERARQSEPAYPLAIVIPGRRPHPRGRWVGGFR